MEKLHRGSSGLPVRILSKSGPADLHMQGERDIRTKRCTVQLEITFKLLYNRIILTGMLTVPLANFDHDNPWSK